MNKWATIILIGLTCLLIIAVSLPPLAGLSEDGLFNRLCSITALILVMALSAEILFCIGLGLVRRKYSGRNKFGWWGSVVFHLSFVVILTGGFISRSTRLDRNIVLTEGRSFCVTEDNFLKPGLFSGKRYNPFDFKLKKFIPVYADTQKPVSFECCFDILEQGLLVKTDSLRVNYPLIYNGVRLVFKRYGFSPLIKIETKQ